MGRLGAGVEVEMNSGNKVISRSGSAETGSNKSDFGRKLLD